MVYEKPLRKSLQYAGSIDITDVMRYIIKQTERSVIMSKTKRTSKKAKWSSDEPSKLYQKRARSAFPILVRQANAGQALTYSDLAYELKMPNQRNLNFVLGAIGNAIMKLRSRQTTYIPPIQSLVINKNTRLPGEGLSSFFRDGGRYRKAGTRLRRKLMKITHHEVFSFDGWEDVLRELGLKPVSVASSIKRSIEKARSTKATGESESHKKLKLFVSRNPWIVGLRDSTQYGEVEHPFPSRDAIDVLFKNGDEWVGIEVKAKHSIEEDITRGIFQCVKYQALIEAEQMIEQLTPSARTVLLIEGNLPHGLIGIKNTLGVEVIENVKRRS